MAGRTLYAMMSTAIGFRNTTARPRFAVVGASILSPPCPTACTSSSKLRSPTSLEVCRGFCPGNDLGFQRLVVRCTADAAFRSCARFRTDFQKSSSDKPSPSFLVHTIPTSMPYSGFEQALRGRKIAVYREPNWVCRLAGFRLLHNARVVASRERAQLDAAFRWVAAEVKVRKQLRSLEDKLDGSGHPK
jgi:hypothetical protein